jgi:hypothetical protein
MVQIFFEKRIITQLVKQQRAFFMEPEGSLSWSQKLATVPYPEPKNQSRSEAPWNISLHIIFLRRGVVSPTPNTQDEVPPLVGCPRLLIQYTRSYHPYLEALSSIRNAPCRGDTGPT